MTREKGKLVLFKTRIGMTTLIEKSDIIPLVNCVWPLSFARIITNKTAIRDRGWFPANRMLLLDPEILKTKASSRDQQTATEERPPPNVIAVNNQQNDDISNISNVSSHIAPSSNPASDAPINPASLATPTSDAATNAAPTIPPSIAAFAPTNFAAMIPPNFAAFAPTNAAAMIPPRIAAFAPTNATPSIADSAATNATSTNPPSIAASAATRSALDNLNFDSGVAGTFALDIFQHLVKKDSVCENLHQRYEAEKSLRENIKKGQAYRRPYVQVQTHCLR